ncbi:hypothetical protein G4B88_003866 [Cannabis sativa]|uniref:Disease resistance N-terminal domain-containing protein n=1 Tax=Cannabis sativa TaxID=3483 RepID=A0A7J6FL14_CANSA|nr:hypothetical protein G4B88_003866 [Cannabis sativa]
MKKWSGGLMIVALAMVLVFRYSLIGTKPPPTSPTQNHDSAYGFFNNHPPKNPYEESDLPILPEIRVKPVKRPHFVNHEGLNELYVLQNISVGDSSPLLVWAQLRSVLARSDALPETAQGIKEASVAWKELVSIIEEKASQLSNIDKSEDKNCPFSVNKLEKTALGDEMVLELPCGLVEDSSISLFKTHGLRSLDGAKRKNTLDLVLGKVLSFVGNELFLLSGVEAELEKIKNELEYMQSLIIDTKGKRGLSDLEKTVVRKFKEKADDIVDFIEEYTYFSNKNRNSNEFYTSIICFPNALIRKHQLATKFQE